MSKQEEALEGYPFVKPCIHCKYWRYIDSGTHFTRANKTMNVRFHHPCCFYVLKNDEPRGEYGGKYCTHFEPIKKNRK